MAEPWREFRDAVRKLAECVADLDDVQPHARRLFIDRFVERQCLEMADWLVEIEESLPRRECERC